MRQDEKGEFVSEKAAETIIALASPAVASSLDEGLDKVKTLMHEAARRAASVVCFPEGYLPGLRGQDFDVVPYGASEHERVMAALSEWARHHHIATIFCGERLVEAGRQLAAYVFDADGALLGCQTKNQLDPSEEVHYVPGSGRTVFDIDGLRFGVAICHEGWRYPETVRWAAVRGASVVFHPQHTGCEREGTALAEWGSRGGPYYEQAMLMRSRENSIYFASVNYALRFQESATSLISPEGECQAYLPYGQEGVLVQPIDPRRATGVLARRLAPDRYGELPVSR